MTDIHTVRPRYIGNNRPHSDQPLLDGTASLACRYSLVEIDLLHLAAVHRHDVEVAVELEAADALETLLEVRLDARRVLRLRQNLQHLVVRQEKEPAHRQRFREGGASGGLAPNPCPCLHTSRSGIAVGESAAKATGRVLCRSVKTRNQSISQFIESKKNQTATYTHVRTHTRTHTRLTDLCPGLPGTRKVKPIWILLKQETVSGSDIKSAPRSSGGSVAEWLACWTQAQNGLGSVLGKLFAPIVPLFTKQRHW